MINGGLRTRKIIKTSQIEKPLITIITVVYNCKETLEKTIQSVLNQTYNNIEYIIIDGASTDGTLDIIKKYEDKIDYWQSEPDNGIYDAMNKGIVLAKGEWINFMNAGDTFSSFQVVDNVFKTKYNLDVTIIYGDSTCILENGSSITCFADAPLEALKKAPVYRHGASFVRSTYHKNNLFNLSRTDIGFALDFLFIYETFLRKEIFQYIPQNILTWNKEGISDNKFLQLKYCYRITKSSKIRYILNLFKVIIQQSKLLHKSYTVVSLFYQNVIINSIMNLIPIWFIRKFILKFSRIKIGRGTSINMFQHFIAPSKFKIGKNSHINRYCLLDARGGITIGNNVSISYKCNLLTGSHDIQTKSFPVKLAPIVIKDNAWIGIGATILQGVRIGKGAVICAGAVVTKDVQDYQIVAGVPANVIGMREKNLDYTCKPKDLFL